MSDKSYSIDVTVGHPDFIPDAYGDNTETVHIEFSGYRDPRAIVVALAFLGEKGYLAQLFNLITGDDDAEEDDS
jgi:hypothetical protein